LAIPYSSRKLAKGISVLGATCALMQACACAGAWAVDTQRNPDLVLHCVKLVLGVMLPVLFFATFVALSRFARRRRVSFALGYTIAYTTVTYGVFAVLTVFFIFSGY
jgi:hypothetical protein